MSSPQPGWYPDPSGDTSKLRYWDGIQWTDNYMDMPEGLEVEASSVQEEAYGAGQESAAQAQSANSDEIPPYSYAGAPGSQSAGTVSQPDGHESEQHSSQPGQPYYYDQPESTYQQYQPYDPHQPYQTGQPIYSQPVYAPGDMPLYPMTRQDETLRLVAFIFALIHTIAAGILIIPLAWMIPMTVMIYKTYKAQRPNTVALGVCSLLFLDMVTGILLLVSTKNQ